jgi:hypothetical protein
VHLLKKYLNQLKKDKIDRNNDKSSITEKEKWGKSEIFAELVGEKRGKDGEKKSEPNQRKKNKKSSLDITKEAAKIAKNFMDDSYTNLHNLARSKSHFNRRLDEDVTDGVMLDGTPRKSRNEYDGEMDIIEDGVQTSAPVKSQGKSLSSKEYIDTDSKDYFVQPIPPNLNAYDDLNSRTKLHNIYDTMKRPKNENQNSMNDPRSELIMPANNIYGMLTKGNKMDQITHQMTPSQYETKVSKAEIEAKDKLDELHQAQLVEKLQKAEIGEALTDLKTVTQNGLKTMFADAVGKQNNFINHVSNYNPSIPRSLSNHQMTEYIGPIGTISDNLYGNEMSSPSVEEEMEGREFSPGVPMYNGSLD